MFDKANVKEEVMASGSLCPPPAISLLYWRRAVAFQAPFDYVNKLMCYRLYGKINAMFGVEYQALIHVRGRQADQMNLEKMIRK